MRSGRAVVKGRTPTQGPVGASSFRAQRQRSTGDIKRDANPDIARGRVRMRKGKPTRRAGLLGRGGEGVGTLRPSVALLCVSRFYAVPSGKSEGDTFGLLLWLFGSR